MFSSISIGRTLRNFSLVVLLALGGTTNCKTTENRSLRSNLPTLTQLDPYETKTSAYQPRAPLGNPEINLLQAESWQTYVRDMIMPDGRPCGDPDFEDLDGDGNRQECVTTSESVSYALVRALINNDRVTFGQVWNWASHNMQGIGVAEVYDWNHQQWSPNSLHSWSLFHWRYIPTLAGRSGGIIRYTEIPGQPWRGGFEVASDADLDIAAALIGASNRGWGNDTYRQIAQSMLDDIWGHLVRHNRLGNSVVPVLFGGNQFVAMGEVNPSYFRPAYFNALFPAFDSNRDHNWPALAASSYRLLVESGDATLSDGNGRVFTGRHNLPPNWFVLTPEGTITRSNVFANQGGQISGWDAFRVYISVAVDWAWNRNEVARRYLNDHRGTTEDYGPTYFFLQQLSLNGRINAGFNHDGSAVVGRDWFSLHLNEPQITTDAVYAPFLYYAYVEGAPLVGPETLTPNSYRPTLTSLLTRYNPTNHRWRDYNPTSGDLSGDPLNYLGRSWVSIGLAFLNNPSPFSATH